MTSRPILLTVSSALAVTLLASTGCRTVKEVYADTVLKGDTVTYEQYLAIEDGVSADLLIARLGKPASVHDRDGKRRLIRYNAFSLTDELKRAEFHFSADEKLEKKELW